MQAIRNLLTNGLNPVTVGGTGTTIKLFPQLPGASIGVASTKNGYLYAPDNMEANGQRLFVHASGNFTIGNIASGSSSPNVTVALYGVTFAGNLPSGAVTVGGQTVAPYTGATAIISQTFNGSSDLVAAGYPWSFELSLEGDNTSGILQAYNGAIAIDGVAGTFSASAALSSINFNSPVPFALVVGVTFSVSDANASANMYEFQMEA